MIYYLTIQTLVNLNSKWNKDIGCAIERHPAHAKK